LAAARGNSSQFEYGLYLAPNSTVRFTERALRGPFAGGGFDLGMGWPKSRCGQTFKSWDIFLAARRVDIDARNSEKIIFINMAFRSASPLNCAPDVAALPFRS
jgi:hypothetical protein